MSDPKEAAEALASAAATAARDPALTPGRQLLDARQARKLSLDDVAQHIKYAPRQIEALECDDYAALPGVAVIRGMVRSYARFLNLEAEPLLEQIRARLAPVQPNVAAPKMDVPFPTRAADGHKAYWVLSGLVALAAAVFVLDWALNARERLAAAVQGVAPAASSPPAPAAAAPITPNAETPGVAPPVDATTGSAIPPSVPGTPPGLAAPVATVVVPDPAVARPRALAPAIAPGAKRVVLRFARDSWVEVRDADGQTLMNRVNPSGTEAFVEGKPPLRLVIGAAAGVTLEYEGKPIDLVPVTQVDVARLTLD